MPNPIATYSALKFLWTESKPIREWLWNKVPMVQDQKKREAAEELLSTLLEDSQKLMRALPPADADAAIEKRLEQFRADLIENKIPNDTADEIVERGALFVRMIVTGPMMSIARLEDRLEGIVAAQQDREKRLLDEIESLKVENRANNLRATVAMYAAFLSFAGIVYLAVR